jgi:hypothetical protein
MGIKEWLVAWRMVKRMKMGTMEVIHQKIPHITYLFNRNSGTILEFGSACIKETVSVTGPGTSTIETLLDNNCSCGFQIEDLFDRSTTASDCCDANQGFDDWAPTMDESDAFEREVDSAKEAKTK